MGVTNRSSSRRQSRSTWTLKSGRRPEDWLKATISEIGAKTAIKIKDKTSVSRAASLIGTESDDCLISDNGKVISRWDLVMKPYAQHRLGVS